MTDLSSLIERLEKATGPDREIDASIWLDMTPGATRKFTDVKSATDLWPPYTIDETRGADGRIIIVPAYTSSIDHAVALAERVLPGWEWTCGRDAVLGISAAVYQSTAIGGAGLSEDDLETAATPALALCLATLRALQSKGPEA